MRQSKGFEITCSDVGGRTQILQPLCSDVHIKSKSNLAPSFTTQTNVWRDRLGMFGGGVIGKRVRFNAARNCSRQKKSGDKRESFFSNVPPPATLIFTRSFYCPKEARTPTRNSVFSCSRVRLPSAADFFQSACVCNRRSTADAPVADPSPLINRNAKIIFCARSWWKNEKFSADFTPTWRGWLDFFARPQEATNKLIGSKAIASLRPLWRRILLINSPIESHTFYFASTGPQAWIFQPPRDQ